MLGLRFCARAFSSCGKRGPLLIAVHGPPTVAASLVAEHRLQTRRLSSCGSRAQLLRGMWDPPRPGLEPASPALAGRLSTTAPPGKSPDQQFLIKSWIPWAWGIYVSTFLNILKSSLPPPLSTLSANERLLFYFILLFIFLNWSIVDLQCCGNYCCTAKWFSDTYIYIFKYSFPWWLVTGYWI